MSRRLTMRLLALALFARSLYAGTLPRGPIVPGQALVGIELGMPEARVTELLGAPKIEAGEARHYPKLHLVVFVRDGVVTELLFSMACQGRQGFADTLDWAKSIRTAEGLGLGSSADAVRLAFGAPDREQKLDEATTLLSYRERGIDLQAGEEGVCSITIASPRKEEAKRVAPQ